MSPKTMSSPMLDDWMPVLLEAWRALGQPRRGPAPRGLPDTSLTPPELAQVARGIKKLSLGLTRDRALAGARYLDEPALLGAYLLFYWPVSYAQGRAVLGELPHRVTSVLDVGAGPGPLAFAALDAGGSQAVLLDRAQGALQVARTLAIARGESVSTRAWSPEQPLPQGPFSVVLLGHVLNELFEGQVARRAALLEQAVERLAPGGSVVVLEPALKETSRGLLAVRDALVARGLAIRAPCLFRGPCPALVKPGDWCHAERDWELPTLTAQLARAAGLHKESLKMSYLVLAGRGEPWAAAPEGQVFRIVSEPLEGKGRQRFMGCGPSGRVGLALQDKHRTPLTSAFFSLKRGDVVRVSHTVEKGDGVALDASSEVEVLALAGRPVKP